MHDGSHRRGGGHGQHRHSAEQAARHKRDQAVFHELLRRHDAIRRSVETIPGGIRAVTESDDPEIAGLIRAHGVVVTGFVRSGGNAAGQPSPLPDDYVRVIS